MSGESPKPMLEGASPQEFATTEAAAELVSTEGEAPVAITEHVQPAAESATTAFPMESEDPDTITQPVQPPETAMDVTSEETTDEPERRPGTIRARRPETLAFKRATRKRLPVRRVPSEDEMASVSEVSLTVVKDSTAEATREMSARTAAPQPTELTSPAGEPSHGKGEVISEATAEAASEQVFTIGTTGGVFPSIELRKKGGSSTTSDVSLETHDSSEASPSSPSVDISGATTSTSLSLGTSDSSSGRGTRRSFPDAPPCSPASLPPPHTEQSAPRLSSSSGDSMRAVRYSSSSCATTPWSAAPSPLTPASITPSSSSLTSSVTSSDLEQHPRRPPDATAGSTAVSSGSGDQPGSSGTEPLASDPPDPDVCPQDVEPIEDTAGVSNNVPRVSQPPVPPPSTSARVLLMTEPPRIPASVRSRLPQYRVRPDAEETEERKEGEEADDPAATSGSSDSSAEAEPPPAKRPDLEEFR